jgi:hypothetical protein
MNYKPEINMTTDEPKEDDASKAIRQKGIPDGLFDKCMLQIRSSHSMGQTLRTLFVVSGLFSDRLLYSELLTQFAVVTSVLDELLVKLRPKSLSLLVDEYNGFSAAYKLDLKYLLKDDLTISVETLTSSAAKAYIKMLRNDIEDGEYQEEALVAALFILWGPLVCLSCHILSFFLSLSYTILSPVPPLPFPIDNWRWSRCLPSC